MQEENSLVKLSQQYLLGTKLGEDLSGVKNELSELHFSDMLHHLSDDTCKKVFWLNMYNAFVQEALKERSSYPSKFFTEKVFSIAGRNFSLDEIEHGILRKGQWKYGLGFIKNPFIAKEIKELQVNEFDFRIHFALNCGAKSCPAIKFYIINELDDELELATKSFLESTGELGSGSRVVKVSKLFLWFLGDFGAFSGIKLLLRKYGVVEENKVKIRFKAYDWTINLANYKF